MGCWLGGSTELQELTGNSRDTGHQNSTIPTSVRWAMGTLLVEPIQNIRSLFTNHSLYNNRRCIYTHGQEI
jgi:hypothetical protein